MIRWDIINSLIKKFNYKSYLEIGVQDPTCNFDKINIETKVSVDPYPRGIATFIETSDDYFNNISKNTKFDIIFIDGLHHDDQVLKDIYNSLNHLNQNGTIVCHDCLPTTELMQQREDHGGEWTGDVWKAIAHLRVNNNNIEIVVVNTDYGCGIIRKNQSKVYIPIQEDYKNFIYFQQYKKEMLNIISIEEMDLWLNSL